MRAAGARELAIVAAIGIVCVSTAPGAAAKAIRCGTRTVPSGDSVLEQSVQTVPGPCGGRRPRGFSPIRNGGGVVPPTTAGRLEGGGPAARALAAIAQATAPPASAAVPNAPAPSAGGSALDGFLDALGGSSGGMGVLLPVALIVTLIVAAGVARRARAGW